MVARKDVQDARGAVMVALMQDDCDLPFTFAQGGLQAAQEGKVRRHLGHLPLVAQGNRQPFEIPSGFVHVGFGDLDVQQPRRGIHRDHPLGRGLADDLLVDLRFGRHVDDDVAHHPRLTAQTPPRRQTANPVVAVFDRVPFRQGIGLDGDAMFRKGPVPRRDLAFGADAAPAADRVQIHPKLPGGGQHRRAKGEPTTFARRGEDHKGFGGHGSPFGADRTGGQPPDPRDIFGQKMGADPHIAAPARLRHAPLRHRRIGLRQSGRSFSRISRFSRRETTSNRKP